jgi:hypothetical protein
MHGALVDSEKRFERGIARCVVALAKPDQPLQFTVRDRFHFAARGVPHRRSCPYSPLREGHREGYTHPLQSSGWVIRDRLPAC